MNSRRICECAGKLIGSGLLIAGLFSMPAHAASFFYFKGMTKAPNERVCLSFAFDQAGKHHLQNISRNNLGVAGTRDNFFVNITCVGNFVIVMVAGDTGTNGSPLAQELFDAVRAETCFDQC
jgi:hypothetical protein